MSSWLIAEPKLSAGCKFKGKRLTEYVTVRSKFYSAEEKQKHVCGNIQNGVGFCEEKSCPIKVLS